MLDFAVGGGGAEEGVLAECEISEEVLPVGGRRCGECRPEGAR